MKSIDAGSLRQADLDTCNAKMRAPSPNGWIVGELYISVDESEQT